jgi:hypothetical protein
VSGLAPDHEQQGQVDGTKRRQAWKRNVPIIALAGLALGVLGFPTGDGTVAQLGYREARSWFADEEAERRAQVVKALESLRVGMSREEMIDMLGPPSAERPIRPNPFGVVRRTLFHDPGRYAVIALLNEADASVYYSVTALSDRVNVRLPRSDARLRRTPLSQVGCSDYVVGDFRASWWDFALVCGGSGADDFVFHIVGWNPYASENGVDEVRAAAVAVGRAFAGPGAAAGRAACLAAAKRASATHGNEWSADFRAVCEFPNMWTEREVADLKSSAEWRTAQEARVDTFAVTAPALVDADALWLFVAVMNGPGPCRSELPSGSARCGPVF